MASVNSSVTMVESRRHERACGNPGRRPSRGCRLSHLSHLADAAICAQPDTEDTASLTAERGRLMTNDTVSASSDTTTAKRLDFERVQLVTGVYADVDRLDIPDPGPGLRGRRHECEVLNRL